MTVADFWTAHQQHGRAVVRWSHGEPAYWITRARARHGAVRFFYCGQAEVYIREVPGALLMSDLPPMAEWRAQGFARRTPLDTPMSRRILDASIN